MVYVVCVAVHKLYTVSNYFFTLISKGAMAYGRILLDHLFSKTEQQAHCFTRRMHANKSSKPTLDKEKSPCY